jgi:hypothetical protein
VETPVVVSPGRVLGVESDVSHPDPLPLRGRGNPTGYCRATAAAPFRSTYFWIFPVAVFGSS